MMVADGVGALAAVCWRVIRPGLGCRLAVFLILFIRSCAGGSLAGMQASTSLMVPKQHLSRIQGLNQMLWVRWGLSPPRWALWLWNCSPCRALSPSM